MNYRDVPRPRVFFEDVPEDIRPTLEGVSGGFEVWGSASDEIHEDDFDLVVTFGADATSRTKTHLSVLSFGATSGKYVTGSEGRWAERRAERYKTTKSRAVTLGEVPLIDEQDWKRLLERTVVENVPDEPDFWITRVGDVSDPWVRSLDLPSRFSPLVVVGSGQPSGPSAFHVPRHYREGLAEWLSMPRYTTDHRAWLVAFLERLRQVDPERYPAAPDWRRRSDWAPVPLLAAIAHRDDLVHEREQEIARLDAAIVEAEGAVEQQAALAAAGPQRLLTEQGEPLVEAVAEALERLGFEVRDMDAEKTEGQAKYEDLRLTDPTESGWAALVEVKGYTRGARANDVAQVVGRPVANFVLTEGQRPDQLLLIVNANCGSDPTGRSVPMDNDPASIATLTENDGALVDTREIFLAVRAVEQGRADAGEVRSSLRAARGRWEGNPVQG